MATTATPRYASRIKTPPQKNTALPKNTGKSKPNSVVKDFLILSKDFDNDKMVRIAKNKSTDPKILAYLCKDYTSDRSYDSWSIRAAALKNPNLSSATIIQLIDSLRDDYNNEGHYYSPVLDNPNISEALLIRYLGSPYLYGKKALGADSNFPTRVYRALQHPQCPLDLLEEKIKDPKCLSDIARNPAISERMAKIIASPKGAMATLPREQSTDILIDLIRNPGVSQKVLLSLMPDENGIWRDGKPLRVHVLRALAVNLTSEPDRQLCLRLLGKKSKAGKNQLLVAYLSEDAESLDRLVNSGERSFAKIAAKRSLDPETSSIIVALRTQGQKEKPVPKPRLRTK